MRKGDWVEFLQGICAIDSRTADGADGTVKVGERIGERLATMGFEVGWADPSPEEQPRGRHLIAVRNADARKRVVLLGHTDTVLSPADVRWAIDERGERVQGAGVCDMKGGCVVMLQAVRHALDVQESVRSCCLVVLLNCAEETSGPSFPKLAREWAGGAAACLGFEPVSPEREGEHLVVTSRKGVVRFHLHCYGRAAHSGNSHRTGINAIREIARKVEEIESLTDYDRELTTNVGLIQGGRASNQVAEEACATFDVRAFDRDVLEDACRRVKDMCSRATVRSASDRQSARLELEEHRSYPAWAPSKATEGLAERYGRLARRRGIRVRAARRGGGADASHVADLAPTLDGLGMLGGGMHSPEEWADLAALPVRARIAGDLIVDICMQENA